MKRIIATMLVAAMSLSLFAGCGSAGSDQQSADAASVAEVTDEAEETVAEETDEAGESVAETAAGVEIREDDDRYLIRVLDEVTEEPIAGARVQLCSDTQCMMYTTGADGFGVFELEPGTYYTHLLTLPEGYKEDVTSYELTADDRSVTYLVSRSEEFEAPEEEASEGASNDNNKYKIKYNETISFPLCGLSFTVPEDLSSLKGQVLVSDTGEIVPGIGVYTCSLYYLARTDEEIDECTEKLSGSSDVSPELQEELEALYSGYAMSLIDYIVVNDSISLENLIEGLGMNKQTSDFTEIGRVNGYVYYIINSEEDAEPTAEIPEDLYDEYLSLKSSIVDLINEYTFSEPPVHPSFQVVGKKVSFETTDLDGNAVKSEDLFKDHKVTMINLWATTCSPCRGELPELEEFNKELAEKDCQVIGLCADTISGQSVIDDAKAILEENGVTYTNLVFINEFFDMFDAPAYPTSYFVGSDGTMLTTPVSGADFEGYEKKIEEALAAVGG